MKLSGDPRNKAHDLNEPDHVWQLSLLKNSLENMALGSAEQIASQPSFVNTANEIVDDFYNAYLLDQSNHWCRTSSRESLRPKLSAVSSFVDEIHARGDASVWTDKALATDLFSWESLRVAAREVLAEM